MAWNLGTISSVTSGAVPTDSLVFYFDAGNPASYPGTGTTWYDLSGGNRHMGMNGSLTYSTSFGGILTSDAKGDYAAVGHDPGVFASNSFTWITFVRGTHPPTTTHNMPDIGYGSISWPRLGLFDFSQYGGGWEFLSYNSSGEGSRYSMPIGASSTTEWKMITAVVDRSAGQGRAYYNGALSNTVSGTPSVGGNVATFGVFRSGNTFDGWNERFIGDIPVVIVYSRALTATEITGVYDYFRGRYGI